MINWLKHYQADRPEVAEISEFEAAIVVMRAISKFIAYYNASCKSFEEFIKWAQDVGHFPVAGDRNHASQNTI